MKLEWNSLLWYDLIGRKKVLEENGLEIAAISHMPIAIYTLSIKNKSEIVLKNVSQVVTPRDDDVFKVLTKKYFLV